MNIFIGWQFYFWIAGAAAVACIDFEHDCTTTLGGPGVAELVLLDSLDRAARPQMWEHH